MDMMLKLKSNLLPIICFQMNIFHVLKFYDLLKKLEEAEEIKYPNEKRIINNINNGKNGMIKMKSN